MIRKIILLVGAMLILPLSGFAYYESSLSIGTAYTTGADAQFTVSMKGYKSTASLISVLTIADSQASDVKSAMFLDKSGWVKLTPYQSGSDVLAKFISDTGFDSAGSRVITLRMVFNTPKTYIVGFSLQDSNGKISSSAAAPLVVNGAKILGESTPVSSGLFTRTLTYGSKGPDVTALQNKLTAEGFYSGPVTGFYGRLTQTAVKKYQAAHGITSNGVVGPQTLAALNQ